MNFIRFTIMIMNYPFIGLLLNICLILILRILLGYYCLPVVQAEGLDSDSLRAIYDAIYIAEAKNNAEMEERRRYIAEYKTSMAYAKDKYDAIQEMKKSQAVLASIPTPSVTQPIPEPIIHKVVDPILVSNQANNNVNASNSSVFKPSEHITDKPIIFKPYTFIEPSMPKDNTPSDISDTTDSIKDKGKGKASSSSSSSSSSSASNSTNDLIVTEPQVQKILNDYYNVIARFEENKQLKQLINSSLIYVKNVVPSDIWAREEWEMSSEDSPFNRYINQISALAPLNNDKDMMSLNNFRITITTYNIIQMLKKTDRYDVIEKVFLDIKKKYTAYSTQ